MEMNLDRIGAQGAGYARAGSDGAPMDVPAAPAELLGGPGVTVVADYQKLVARLKMESEDQNRALQGQQFANALLRLVAQNDAITERQKTALTDVANATKALESAQAVISSTSTAMQVLIEEIADLTKAMSTTAEERRKRLDAKARAEANVAEKEAARDAAVADQTKTDAERAAAESAYQAAVAELGAIETDITRLDGEIEKQNDKLSALETRRDTLQAVLDTAKGMAEAAEAALQDAVSRLDTSGRQVLAEVVGLTAGQIEQAAQTEDDAKAEEVNALVQAAERLSATILERTDAEIAALIAKVADVSAPRASELLTPSDLLGEIPV